MALEINDRSLTGEVWYQSLWRFHIFAGGALNISRVFLLLRFILTNRVRSAQNGGLRDWHFPRLLQPQQMVDGERVTPTYPGAKLHQLPRVVIKADWVFMHKQVYGNGVVVRVIQFVKEHRLKLSTCNGTDYPHFNDNMSHYSRHKIRVLHFLLNSFSNLNTKLHCPFWQIFYNGQTEDGFMVG